MRTGPSAGAKSQMRRRDSRSRSPRRHNNDRERHRDNDDRRDYRESSSSYRERDRGADRDRSYRSYRSDSSSTRDDRGSSRSRYIDDRPPSQSQHQHQLQSKYDLPTTESLHAKKLSALDHESFLQSRQKEREGKGSVKGLWPVTPPRAEFFYGEYIEDEAVIAVDAAIAVDSVTRVTAVDDASVTSATSATNDTDTVHVDTSNATDIGEVTVVRVKAPSASKPSINSFSSSKPVKYGGDMMPGEGTAMAGFVASGQRIPRRGEIGMDSDTISRFETAGYVMSGSRHHLMNAVRMRKENQVISAEEKRMISQMALEERVKREEEIVRTFKSMVEEKLKKKQQ